MKTNKYLKYKTLINCGQALVAVNLLSAAISYIIRGILGIINSPVLSPEEYYQTFMQFQIVNNIFVGVLLVIAIFWGYAITRKEIKEIRK